MAWTRGAQEELEVQGELNQVNLLLCDFTETAFATKGGVRADDEWRWPGQRTLTSSGIKCGLCNKSRPSLAEDVPHQDWSQLSQLTDTGDAPTVTERSIGSSAGGSQS
jgi:hypothetical protein